MENDLKVNQAALQQPNHAEMAQKMNTFVAARRAMLLDLDQFLTARHLNAEAKLPLRELDGFMRERQAKEFGLEEWTAARKAIAYHVLGDMALAGMETFYTRYIKSHKEGEPTGIDR